MKKYWWIILLVVVVAIGVSLYWLFNKPYSDDQTKNVVENTEAKEEKTVDEEKKDIISTYDNPFVPEHFIRVDTERAEWNQINGTITDWNKGLVIEDANKNQYVWVPVDQKTVKKDGYYTSNHGENGLITLEGRANNQIDRCGGFYIGRYECGVPEELNNEMSGIDQTTNMIKATPVVKQGAKPWNFITHSYAIENAQKIVQQADSESVLIPEGYWLIVMQWLRSSGFDVDRKSADFGNYADSYFDFSGLYSEDEGKSFIQGNDETKGSVNILLATGISEKHVTNNIYDIAGNVNEFVDGELNNCFGGNYSSLGTAASAGVAYSKRDSNSFTGFRAVLLNVLE